MLKNKILTPEIIESIDNTIRLMKELTLDNEQDKKTYQWADCCAGMDKDRSGRKNYCKCS